ncbi:hypothetical protein EV182_000042 [Spiromyces aspiralis]|uniref:Uncharacterized protein n=1 Tax=Spiromyces aspiralis TaxID=68401 RepID=A0ACC1HHL9_9FUNG|nr:hypothetical protein EV182_000042 [Spiromyces aspiralis]
MVPSSLLQPTPAASPFVATTTIATNDPDTPHRLREFTPHHQYPRHDCPSRRMTPPKSPHSPPHCCDRVPNDIYRTVNAGPFQTVAAAESFTDVPRLLSRPSSSTATAATIQTRPPNSFILYRRDKARELTSHNTSLNQSEISRIVAALWKNESIEVKEHYRRRQNEEKRRFEEIRRREGLDPSSLRKIRRQQQQQQQQKQQALQGCTTGTCTLPSGIHCRNYPPGSAAVLAAAVATVAAPSRPMNTFICYRNKKMEELRAKNSRMSQTQISKIISEMWKNEAPEVKAYFRQQYQKEKQRMDVRAGHRRASAASLYSERRHLVLSSSSSSSSSGDDDSCQGNRPGSRRYSSLSPLPTTPYRGSGSPPPPPLQQAARPETLSPELEPAWVATPGDDSPATNNQLVTKLPSPNIPLPPLSSVLSCHDHPLSLPPPASSASPATLATCHRHSSHPPSLGANPTTESSDMTASSSGGRNSIKFLLCSAAPDSPATANNGLSP